MNTSEAKRSLSFSLGPDGVAVLKFSGALLENDSPAFRDDLALAAKKMRELFGAGKQKLRVLIDVTDFSGKYSAETLQMLADFAKNNATIVEKTASFGGTDKVKAAGEAAANLAGRENISIFDTREQALAFLAA